MQSSIAVIAATTLILLVSVNTTNGKVFTKCELKKALEKNKVCRSFISTWVCLADSESGIDSTKLTKTISYNMYGIFQIRGNEWCGIGGVIGGECWTRCENFLDDKLDDDIACAMKVSKKCGYKHWQGWVAKCKMQKLPNLLHC